MQLGRGSEPRWVAGSARRWATRLASYDEWHSIAHLRRIPVRHLRDGSAVTGFAESAVCGEMQRRWTTYTSVVFHQSGRPAMKNSKKLISTPRHMPASVLELTNTIHERTSHGTELEHVAHNDWLGADSSLYTASLVSSRWLIFSDRDPTQLECINSKYKLILMVQRINVRGNRIRSPFLSSPSRWRRARCSLLFAFSLRRPWSCLQTVRQNRVLSEEHADGATSVGTAFSPWRSCSPPPASHELRAASICGGIAWH